MGKCLLTGLSGASWIPYAERYVNRAGFQRKASLNAPTIAEMTLRMDLSHFGQRVQENLRNLQTRISQAIAAEDGRDFLVDHWSRPEGGGGISMVLENGNLIEKGGVLFSAVSGDRLPPVVHQQAAGVDPETGFFATGVSLILHPHNPYVPTVHFNVRYFETGSACWFGGGMDLTPYYPFQEDCIHFHRTIKTCCDRFDPNYYARFKPWCDRYFFLKHRQEARGIGGIFFNYLKGDRERLLDFILELGAGFGQAYLPIVQRRKTTVFGDRERAFQCYRRGRYVEFNLLYDQGTLFGLQSNGRVESILVSMPPLVQWRYDWQAEPGSPEESLGKDFLPPRDWASL